MMRRGMRILLAVLMVLALATSAMAGGPGDPPVFDDELQCNIVWLGGEKVCID